MSLFVPGNMPEGKHGRKQAHVRCKFTKQEDAQLVSLVSEMGTRDWDAIARRIPNRNARQCRERYSNYLAPNLSHEPWTPEEDSLLEQKLKEFGAKWVNISKYFKNRTDTMLKNRWLVLSRRSPRLAKQKERAQEAKKKQELKRMAMLNPMQQTAFIPQYIQQPQMSYAQIPIQIPTNPTPVKENIDDKPKNKFPPLANLLNLSKVSGLFDIEKFASKIDFHL